MGIAARLCPFTTSCVQRFRISGGKLGNHCKECPETAQLLQRCGNENGIAYCDRSDDDVPRPILIFIAA